MSLPWVTARAAGSRRANSALWREAAGGPHPFLAEAELGVLCPWWAGDFAPSRPSPPPPTWRGEPLPLAHARRMVSPGDFHFPSCVGGSARTCMSWSEEAKSLQHLGWFLPEKGWEAPGSASFHRVAWVVPVALTCPQGFRLGPRNLVEKCSGRLEPSLAWRKEPPTASGPASVCLELSCEHLLWGLGGRTLDSEPGCLVFRAPYQAVGVAEDWRTRPWGAAPK